MFVPGLRTFARARRAIGLRTRNSPLSAHCVEFTIHPRPDRGQGRGRWRRRGDWPRTGEDRVSACSKPAPQRGTEGPALGRDVIRLEAVDHRGVGANEVPFVGEQRHRLVERLLAEFDKVSQFGRPRWWSLEEHSGWGKTRIVQELYRRLAAQRQPGAKYWPPSLHPQAPVAGGAGPLMSMRKKVIPETLTRKREAVPQWFWWGISCAERSGTAVQALADDLTQFADHEVGLEQKIGRASC